MCTETEYPLGTYTLREIAGWIREGAKVSLPDLQRGLVWKARQMELLWDSILRGFPIGSFMLSDNGNGSYYLMDGQQRYNAIATGFGTVDQPGAMLWLDLAPKTVKGSTRKYWVKATTIAHPWGFSNDDECTALSAERRRQAMGEFGIEGTIFNQKIHLGQTWPIEAVRPVPLSFFLNAPLTNEDDFLESIVNQSKDNCEIMPCLEKICKVFSDEDRKNIRSLYQVFKKLENYTVQCNILPREVINQEADHEGKTDEMIPLEVLFNRLNTGGTRISQDDLNYSAIKAYWGDIKDKNESVAKQYMSPAKLVMLVFRLALTQSDIEKGLSAPLSIRKIRDLAQKEEEQETKIRIKKLYANLEEIMVRVDEWLNVYNSKRDQNAMPAYIRTSIARNSPEVFLLLMFLAAEELEGKMEILPSDARGLALLLHWFGIDRKRAAEEIFKHIKKGWSLDSVREGLAECLEKNYLLPMFSPQEMRQFFTIQDSPNWDPWSAQDHAPWHDFFSRISWWGYGEAREMLLFAQRAFINEKFSLYDPAREDMWENHNRPWDYDHIIPQNWIKEKGRRRTEYKDYCDFWLGRIGNIGAIPFEVNRSKSDKDDDSIYRKNEEALLFDPRFSELFKDNYSLPEKKESSFKFAQTVFDRTAKIYNECFDLFAPLLEKTNLTERQAQRKEIMEYLADQLNQSGLNEVKTVYVAKSGVLCREYPIKPSRDADWTRDWISVGVCKGKFFVSFTWGCQFDGHDYNDLEIGLRKLPEKDIDKDRTIPFNLPDGNWDCSNNFWWYAIKNLPHADKDEVLKELKALLECFQTDES